MANLYQALGGGQPSADQQPSAPVPPASAGVGAGSPQLPGLFQALQQQQAQQPQSLQPGPLVADATIPIDQKKMQDLMKGFRGVR